MSSIESQYQMASAWRKQWQWRNRQAIRRNQCRRRKSAARRSVSIRQWRGVSASLYGGIVCRGSVNGVISVMAWRRHGGQAANGSNGVISGVSAWHQRRRRNIGGVKAAA